jgi:hypothetical protein
MDPPTLRRCQPAVMNRQLTVKLSNVPFGRLWALIGRAKVEQAILGLTDGRWGSARPNDLECANRGFPPAQKPAQNLPQPARNPLQMRQSSSYLQ